MNEGANDQSAGEPLVFGRLVPDGRDGNTVYARSLRPGEEDTGEVVHIGAGERLVIRAGGLSFNTDEIDAQSERGLGGYAPVSNTVWTWYRIVGEQLGYFLLFFSLARRLDSVHALWASTVEDLRRARGEDGIPRRARISKALSTAEVTLIALHRGITMIDSLIENYDLDLTIPDSIEGIHDAIREMRHAFEHIDDRAQGRIGMSGELNPDALSIFNQPDFFQSAILRYKEYSLNFEEDILAALLDSRDLVMATIDARVASQDPNDLPNTGFNVTV